MKVLVLGYESMYVGSRGTRVLVLGYEGIGCEGIGSGVGEYWFRGTKVLVLGYEGISSGVRRY